MEASERRKRASAEAAEWLVCPQDEEVSCATREEFVGWLRESALHVAEMPRVAHIHGALVQFQSWTRISTEGSSGEGVVVHLPTQSAFCEEQDDGSESTPEENRNRHKGGNGASSAVRVASRTRRVWQIGALAAAMGAVGVATVWLLSNLNMQTIQTDRGERREVALTDGSVVQVDPQTRLRIRFEAGSRRVVLERGRALFRVRPIGQNLDHRRKV